MLPVTQLRQCGVGGTTRLATIFGADAVSSRVLGVSSAQRRHFHATPVVNSVVRKRPLMESFDRRLLRAMTEPVYPKEVLYPVKVQALTPYQEVRLLVDVAIGIKTKVLDAFLINVGK